MRRSLMVYWLLGALFLTCLGCAAVDKSIENYKACKGDQVCLQEMENVKDVSYHVTKGAASSFPLPNVYETFAIAISNIAAFLFGAHKGSKIVLKS